MAKVAVLALLIIGMAEKPAVVWTKPGEIRVIVVDRESLPISGVTVTISSSADPSRPRVAVTNPNGRVEFTDVAAGEYVLKFELSGFATCSIGPITMRSQVQENPHLPEFVVTMNPVLWVG